MTPRSATSLGLTLATLALVGACAGGSTPSFADAGLDARWIGRCDPDRVRPLWGLNGIVRDCMSNSDCVDGVNGRCTLQGPYTWCTYDQCFSDADCPAGARCACGVEQLDGNMCLLDDCSGCAADQCAPSWGCAGHVDGSSGGVQSFECYTPDDSCHTDADCRPGEFCTRGPSDNTEGGPPDPSWHCASVSRGF